MNWNDFNASKLNAQWQRYRSVTPVDWVLLWMVIATMLLLALMLVLLPVIAQAEGCFHMGNAPEMNAPHRAGWGGGTLWR